MRELVEIAFAVEHKERQGRTVAGQIARFLSENPGVAILESKKQHADEFTLFMLQTILSTGTVQEACVTIAEATEGSRVTVVAFSGSGETRTATWSQYATHVQKKGMLIRAFSDGNPNPLKKQRRKRARADQD
jgi:hypothetical protein